MRCLSRWFLGVALVGLLIPAGLGYLLDGTLKGALTESWHPNHHAFPRSAVHGMKWWEIDTTAAVIRTLMRLGLAWNVVEISPERQAPKRAAVGF